MANGFPNPHFHHQHHHLQEGGKSIPTLAGIKYSSADFGELTQMLAVKSPRGKPYKIFHGEFLWSWSSSLTTKFLPSKAARGRIFIIAKKLWYICMNSIWINIVYHQEVMRHSLLPLALELTQLWAAHTTSCLRFIWFFCQCIKFHDRRLRYDQLYYCIVLSLTRI